MRAVEDGDVKKASRILDPDNFGLNEWTDEVKIELRAKFPQDNTVIKNLEAYDNKFHCTKISDYNIFKVINQGSSKAGGINHIGYNIIKKLVKLKNPGPTLLHAITELTNHIANTNIENLEHFMATRTIPVRKKDGSTRPVGVGDIIRRICLKAIDLHHRQAVISQCNRQLGNGVKGGCESTIHALRE